MKMPSQPRITLLAAAIALAFSGEAASQVPSVCDTPTLTCTVTSSADNSSLAAVVPGSLRDAVNFINGACGCAGPYNVRFAFTGLTTITLQQPLLIGGFGCAARISGYDGTAGLPATPNTVADIRSGSNANPLVVLDAAAVSGAALILQAPNSGVKGLVFQNYGTTAIQVQGSGVSIAGNHIGTNPAGTACVGAGVNGVGIEVTGGGSSFSIGGGNPGDRNIIGCSSSNNAGIDISAFQGGVTNNLIGTGSSGQALPNDVGVLVSGISPFAVNVGLPSIGLGNVIARNSRAGVVVAGINAFGVSVQGNDIFLNGTLGIDLDNSGAVPPVGDGVNAPNPSTFAGSSLPNSNINRPQITFVRYNPGVTFIDWSYSGFANSNLYVDFYTNPPGLGIDEGARWVSTATAFTTGTGTASGTTNLVGNLPSPTATSTMISSGFVSNVGTSEFSAPPALEVSPKTLVFASTVGNTSAPQTVTFTNLGTSPITIGPPLTVSSFLATATPGCDGTTPLAAGANCTVDVSYSPLFVGAAFDFLDMPMVNGTGGGRGVGLEGNAVPNPIASATPAGPVDFGATRVGVATPTTTFTFSNSGDSTYDINTVTLTGPSAASFQIVSDTCTNATVGINPLLLVAGGKLVAKAGLPVLTCTVGVAMLPAAGGALTAALTINSTATNPTLSVSLTGTGLAPVLASNPAGSVNFGTVQVGATSAPVSVNFTNSGNGSLTVAGATITGAAATSFQVVADGCAGQTLTATPPGSCAVTLAMQPQSAGALSATLQVSSDATNPSLALPLVGTGSTAPVAAPRLGITPAGPVDFGPRRVGTQTPPTVFTVAPSAAGPVAISSVAPRGTGFNVLSDTCTGATLALGATPSSCTFSVVFAPAFEGAYRTSIQVLSNAANPQLLLDVAGTGTPPPVGRLAASPSSVPFGIQAVGVTTNPQTVQVTNTGTLPVTVGGVRVTGDFAQTNDCRFLDAGQSCRALVTFTPTAQGERGGNLVVDSDAVNPQLVVPLQGTASPAPIPIVELNPAAISFGTSLMGSGGGGTPITLRNAGGASLALGSIYAIGDFRVTHACPPNLPPGASCVLTVIFQPSISGARTGKVIVESNAPAGSKEAPLSGTGCRSFGLGTSRLAQPSCK